MTMRKMMMVTGGVACAMIGRATMECTAEELIQTAGPTGGPVKDLAEHDGEVIASVGLGGAFAQANRGGVWGSLVKGLPMNLATGDVVESGSGLVMVVANQILRFPTGGSGWLVSDPGVMDAGATSLVKTSGAVFALIEQPGANPPVAVRTSDGGVSWDVIALPAPSATGLMGLGDSLVSLSPFAAHVSVDDGETWAAASGLPGDFYAPLVSEDGLGVVRLLFTDETYRSLDGGATWMGDVAGLTDVDTRPSAVARITAMELIAATRSDLGEVGLVRTLDNGGSWMPMVSIGLPPLMFQSVESLSLLQPTNGDLVVGTALGAYRSTDDGATFSDANTGLVATSVKQVASTGTRLLASLTTAPGQHSGDDAQTWGSFQGIDATSRLKSFANLGDGIILAGTESVGLYRSFDDGVSWRAVNTSLPTYNSPSGDRVEPINDFAVAGNTIMLATGGGPRFIVGNPHCGCNQIPSGDGVYVSMNGGETWVRRSTGLPVNQVDMGDAILHPVVALHQAGDGSVLAATIAGIYRTLNLGLSWNQVSAASVVDIADIEGVLYGMTDEGELWRSETNGASWSAVATDLPAGVIMSAILGHRGDLYAAAAFAPAGDATIYRSDVTDANPGASWTAIDADSAGVRVSSLAVHDCDVYAATGSRGVWRATPTSADLADVNNSGAVTFDDVIAVINAFGPCDCCAEDITGNAAVTFDDLIEVINNF